VLIKSFIFHASAKPKDRSVSVEPFDLCVACGRPVDKLYKTPTSPPFMSEKNVIAGVVMPANRALVAAIIVVARMPSTAEYYCMNGYQPHETLWAPWRMEP